MKLAKPPARSVRPKRINAKRKLAATPEFKIAPLGSPRGSPEETEKLIKAEKKKLKKLERKQRKERLGAMKEMASSFPMIAVIEERIDDSIPKEIVERIKSARSPRRRSREAERAGARPVIFSALH